MSQDGRRRNPLKRFLPPLSVLFLIFSAALAVGARAYAAHKYTAAQEESETRGMPVIAKDGWVGDLRAYHGAEGKFPETLVELEKRIWTPRRVKNGENPAALKQSVLSDGQRMYMKNNYVYIYYRDADPHVCGVWAIPVGENRTKGNTYLFVITLSAVDEYKGAALSDEMYKLLPRKALPTPMELVKLGMTKQKPSAEGSQPARKKGGGLMNNIDSFFEWAFGTGA